MARLEEGSGKTDGSHVQFLVLALRGGKSVWVSQLTNMCSGDSESRESEFKKMSSRPDTSVTVIVCLGELRMDANLEKHLVQDYCTLPNIVFQQWWEEIECQFISQGATLAR